MIFRSRSRTFKVKVVGAARPHTRRLLFSSVRKVTKSAARGRGATLLPLDSYPIAYRFPARCCLPELCVSGAGESRVGIAGQVYRLLR